ncbi:unnamed protein product [Arabidopsis halleri]
MKSNNNKYKNKNILNILQNMKSNNNNKVIQIKFLNPA